MGSALLNYRPNLNSGTKGTELNIHPAQQTNLDRVTLLPISSVTEGGTTSYPCGTKMTLGCAR